MPTYEMFWDCDNCGTRKLLGKSHRHCPNCGSVQDPSARYFPAENEKVAVENHVFHGVDWSCERCETPNSAAASHCVNCGDARDGSESEVKRRGDVLAGTQAGEQEDWEGEGGKAPKRRPRGRPKPRLSAEQMELEEDFAQARGRKAWMKWVLLGVAALVSICGGLCVFSIFWTAPTTVEVTGHSWQRDITIEKLAPRSDSAWCDSMPSDAYGVSRSQKQRGSNSIPDGETCSTVNSDNGDGTYSTSTQCTTNYREEPIYDDWCSYTVDRWGHSHTESASGKGLTRAPHWPAYSVSDCSSLGCTRVGGRRQSYWVAFVDSDGTDQSCDFDQKLWASMPVGSRWGGQKQVIWDNLVCSGLIREEAK